MAQLKTKTVEKTRRLGTLLGLLSGDRAKLLTFLRENGPTKVGALAEAMGLSPSGVSQHLQKLKPYGIVTSTSERQERIYSLNEAVVQEAASLLSELLLSKEAGPR